MQRGGVIFRSGALRSLSRSSGGAVQKAPSDHTFPDARVHAGARHFQPSQLTQWVRSHVQQAAVGATELLKQHLGKEDGMITHTTTYVPNGSRLGGRVFVTWVGGMSWKGTLPLTSSQATIPKL